ncbi:MAG: HAMP domain-containing histidine kinase [bacterium]|nr:HAMP domain-containing histidine kinase [bacterium]
MKKLRLFGRKMSLRQKIANYLAVTVVAILLMSAIVLIVVRHRFIVQSMEASARTYSALISQPVASSVQQFQSTGWHILRQRLEDWRALNEDITRLEVVHVDGSVVLSANGPDLVTMAELDEAPTIDDPELLRDVRSLEVRAETVVSDSGKRRYRVVAPAIEEWGRHTYSLVVYFDYARVDRQLILSAWLLVGSIAVALVLAGLVSSALSRSITRSLAKLQSGVRRIRDGNIDERVEIDGGDEISELADAFNAMSHNLVQTIGDLREANLELERLDQAKIDLLANVSHELRTPLTALRGYLELMEHGDLGDLTVEAKRGIEICQKNVKRLSYRIEELVQLSRLDTSLPEDVPREPIAIGQLLHGVVETLIPKLEENDIVCSLNLATDLHPVWGHPEHVERVFLNLLDNAVKFTPAGGHVRISVEPYTRDDKLGVLVRVADTGTGIPQNQLVRIFDRFYQIDPSSRRRYAGMGVGLSLVRTMIEANRGAVWVESQVSRGSTFFVWLPSSQHASASGGVRVLAEEHESDSLERGRPGRGDKEDIS